METQRTRMTHKRVVTEFAIWQQMTFFPFIIAFMQFVFLISFVVPRMQRRTENISTNSPAGRIETGKMGKVIKRSGKKCPADPADAGECNNCLFLIKRTNLNSAPRNAGQCRGSFAHSADHTESTFWFGTEFSSVAFGFSPTTPQIARPERSGQWRAAGMAHFCRPKPIDSASGRADRSYAAAGAKPESKLPIKRTFNSANERS